ncbi:MAG: ornithine carbamoyltransferase [Dehalococcoidia bacterium]|nr:ornithine carbamoyltransferase [Dehalococcoidia bacterium]MCB9485941.1 ornithine carbamoyltransferase [Thermoflexaceae bacterium]
MPHSPRHLISSADLSAAEIQDLVKLALVLKRTRQRVLDGRQLALLFEKPSLRTRVSFQVGMRHLGGDSVYLTPQEGVLGEREPIKDVARVLGRYVDIVAIRTFGQAIVDEYASYSTIPVINALTNEEHPCQALADLVTLTEHLEDVSGHTLAFIGDGNNVATSLALTAVSLGMHVRIATPRGYQLPEWAATEASIRAAEAGGSFATLTDPELAAEGADALYTDTWTSMGFEREAERRRMDFAGFQVNAQLRKIAGTGVLVMHDLPAHRGEEITDEAFEGEGSIIFDQAENRTWAQAAAICKLLGVDHEVRR